MLIVDFIYIGSAMNEDYRFIRGFSISKVKDFRPIEIKAFEYAFWRFVLFGF